MQRTLSFFAAILVISGGSVFAQSTEEAEIAALIEGPDVLPYSSQGALEFWSSGGLLQEIPPEGRTLPFDEVNLSSKHAEVLILVPGEAAVVHFYSEGTMTPQGFAPVPDYLTRVSQVLVKEDGEWRIRSSHWSPVRGSSGTSQTARGPAADENDDSE